MTSRKWICIVLLALLALSVSACAGSVATPTVSATAPTSPTTPAPAATVTLTSTPPKAATAPPTQTPVEPTPTPVVCLDEAAQPIAVPGRQSPLEVQFISGGNLWAWTEGAEAAVQISDTRDAQTFSFSPDGQVIAFMRGEPYRQTELWSIRRDGSDLRLLLSADQMHAMMGEPTTTDFTYTDSVNYLAWLDGGALLGFEVYRNYAALGGCCDSGGTWKIDTLTAELSAWTPPSDSATGGLISPDGTQVALAGETSLSLVNVDGSNRRENVLTYPYTPHYEGGGFYPPQVYWASDSQSLAVITYSEILWEPGAAFTTWRVPVDGRPAQKLHEFQGIPFSAFPSPDHRYLVYRTAPRPLSNHWALHLATFDGSQDFVYAEGQQMEVWGWAPDGVHFLYSQDSNREPFLGSLCGGSQPLLSPQRSPLWNLTWVDAQRFVFTSGGEGPTESQLRLGTVGGEIWLIGPQQGEYAQYTIKP